MSELFHPLAALFPLLSGAPFDALVEDIQQNGLREPIWRHQDGRIVDGRNRWRACRDLGVNCPSNTFVGSDEQLLAFIVSMNLHRRHLDESRRAMVAARLATLKDGQRKSASPIGEATSQADAAELLNVGKRSIERARVVLDNAVPELVELVDGGKLPVSAAADVAKLPAEKQDELVARGEVEILAKAKRSAPNARERSASRGAPWPRPRLRTPGRCRPIAPSASSTPIRRGRSRHTAILARIGRRRITIRL